MRLAAIAAALAVSFAVAGEARAVLILGHGTDTCATWLQVRTTPRAGEYRQWMLGYLSASAFHKNRDILRNMNAEQVFTRVTADCQRTPTRRIDDVLDGFLR
ncbi:hypothetical protein [Phreatobacter sp.]|uniref:hypothetical protein n=1 Tax=Phreatobacter sp. TaxID=1966341 RepID=UPI0022C6C62C|nr:hypothetical protein [Phreatobacter sp.]MCZ8315309.1 hypothetical protein [Phreatobacter sp.]